MHISTVLFHLLKLTNFSFFQVPLRPPRRTGKLAALLLFTATLVCNTEAIKIVQKAQEISNTKNQNSTISIPANNSSSTAIPHHSPAEDDKDLNGLYVYEYEPEIETPYQLDYLEEPSKEDTTDFLLDHLKQSDQQVPSGEPSQATRDDLRGASKEIFSDAEDQSVDNLAQTNTDMLEYEEGSSHDNLDYLEEEPSNDPLDYLYSDEAHESQQEYYDEYLEYDVIGNETLWTNGSAEILPSALPLVGGEERFLNGVGANFMEQGEN